MCFMVQVTKSQTALSLIVNVWVHSWALLLYNEERQVKCGIALQFALETSI